MRITFKIGYRCTAEYDVDGRRYLVTGGYDGKADSWQRAWSGTVQRRDGNGASEYPPDDVVHALSIQGGIAYVGARYVPGPPIPGDRYAHEPGVVEYNGPTPPEPVRTHAQEWDGPGAYRWEDPRSVARYAFERAATSAAIDASDGNDTKGVLAAIRAAMSAYDEEHSGLYPVRMAA